MARGLATRLGSLPASTPYSDYRTPEYDIWRLAYYPRRGQSMGSYRYGTVATVTSQSTVLVLVFLHTEQRAKRSTHQNGKSVLASEILARPASAMVCQSPPSLIVRPKVSKAASLMCGLPGSRPAPAGAAHASIGQASECPAESMQHANGTRSVTRSRCVLCNALACLRTPLPSAR